MRFFKSSVYVLFVVAITNLAFNLYMYRELRKPNIIVTPDPGNDMKILQEQTMMRDTQLLQGILMIHHDRDMHPAGTQQLCPLCDKHNQLKSIIVQKEQ
tara:strand:+ start:274 stop:570 length:297 start_codon:yes stop_codon:yes gene_type:complete